MRTRSWPLPADSDVRVPEVAIEPVRELADRIPGSTGRRGRARRLLHEVVRSPVLVRMLAEPEPELRTRDLVVPGRIVLISGDAGRVGEPTARYLLAVYFALVWSELLAREGAPKTFVMLDEAQWFSHESLGEMLRLGRRKNVHVVLATQGVGSLPPAVADAVWTNVSDFVAFRGSPEEAREFTRASRAVSAEDLLALPRGEAAVLLGKGHFVRWVKTIRIPGAPAVPPDRENPEGGGSVAPDSGGPGVPLPGEEPGEPSRAPSTRVAAVLGYLAERAVGLAPGVPLVVRLEDLRREVDPDGVGSVARDPSSVAPGSCTVPRGGRPGQSGSWTGTASSHCENEGGPSRCQLPTHHNPLRGAPARFH